MEEIECIVCFSQYDGEEHRPRLLPCGHGMCTECLRTAIRGNSGKCPKCRAQYSATKVEDIPINYPLESVIKLLSISQNNQVKDLPTCAEHQLLVSHRCTTHKTWACQNCIKEDHSSDRCKIIKISEELDNRKTKQLGLSKLVLDIFEESCKRAEESKQKYEKVFNEQETKIKKLKDEQESMYNKFQEKIQREENVKQELKEKYSANTKKIEDLIGKRNLYDQAEKKLKSSDTIREVSKNSTDVQNEAEKLQSISCEIKTEVDLMQQSYKKIDEYFIGYPKMSVKDGKIHLHVLENADIYKSLPHHLQFIDDKKTPLTDGILTFLDLAWPNQEPRRVYMKMLGNTNRARQHLLFTTGQCGHSYRGLDFAYLVDNDKPGRLLIIKAYDGKKAAAILDDVKLNSKNCEIKTGLVAGAVWISDGEDENTNNGLFSVYLSDNPGKKDDSGFAQVTVGLDILQDIAKEDERENIKIIDCGVVLSW